MSIPSAKTFEILFSTHDNFSAEDVTDELELSSRPFARLRAGHMMDKRNERAAGC